MSDTFRGRIGVLTSGGDAPGMNSALRSVVRTALEAQAEVFAIYEGYKGMVQGGDSIRRMEWGSVGGILYLGGTVIGTARCQEFRTRPGRLQAAQNLLTHSIDRLVVIGGDGSLTGANLFSQEWSSLLAELVEQGRITPAVAQQHPHLYIVGLIGSIDNDMHGTDMTIGTDTALHRITEAIDAINSTASSHQRTFVIEVMGRNCGYLALMSALSTGANWVMIPESPPEMDNWEEEMCNVLSAGRTIGRRHNIVIVAEGACDRNGNSISCDYVKRSLEERLGEDTRVTILGHVQRGGSPSAYDRNMSSLCGYAAVYELLNATPETEPQIIGMHNNRITRTPLMHAVEQTHEIARAIQQRDFARALKLRGNSFQTALETISITVQAIPRESQPGQSRIRIGLMNCGALAPGMNTAARVAVRLGLDRGHTILGIQNGFQGLLHDEMTELGWMDVSGWTGTGGAELGTNELVPGRSEYYAIARTLEKQQINALLIVGGNTGYQAAYNLHSERSNFPAFNIPIVCLPASINNDLAGAELSIGSDTALNSIVEAVDKIKQSAVASRRCFLVEVMGGNCGYLATMSGMATGAERIYTQEEGVRLRDLQTDIDHMIAGFQKGKRLGLIIRNENANPLYTTNFMEALFEEEGSHLFEVRHAILGHLQHGGNPTPFDRIQATRFASHCINYLINEAKKPEPIIGFLGRENGKMKIYNIEDWPRMMDLVSERPKYQWWMELMVIVKALSGGSTDQQYDYTHKLEDRIH